MSYETTPALSAEPISQPSLSPGPWVTATYATPCTLHEPTDSHSSPGDFTARPGDFASFNSRAAKGELHHLPVINAFFDDQKHFQEVQALCGYTHPILTQDEGKAPRPQFKSVSEMRKFIEHNYKQSFCDICIASRKVFLSEQILYTKQQLERHNLRGDDEGPLAAESSGFKGHPICKFCKQRFYDGQELYKHMESAHEHCFICRKAQPDKFVYYRHYQGGFRPSTPSHAQF